MVTRGYNAPTSDKASQRSKGGHGMSTTGMTTVLGAGTMGAGIAQCLSDHGQRVTLCDLQPLAIERARERITTSRATLESAGLQTHDQSLVGERLLAMSCSLDDAVAESDLIIESISEDIHLKCDVFAQLDRSAPPHAAIVSNTSGLSITRLAEATDRPTQVAGFHWFNPAELIPLVEVTSGAQTDPSLIAQLMTLARQLGKEPIHVRRDVPGFVGNRLQFAVFREALHLLDEGVVSAEDLDRAMTGGPGFRWSFLGPLRAADFGGLDVFHSICSYLWPDLSDATSPPPVLNEKLQAGDLGTKAGAGFYRYPPDELADLTDRRDRFLLNLKQLVEDMKTNKEKPSPAKTQATSSSNLDNAKR